MKFLVGMICGLVVAIAVPVAVVVTAAVAHNNGPNSQKSILTSHKGVGEVK